MALGAVARCNEVKRFISTDDHWLFQQDIETSFQAELCLLMMIYVGRDDESSVQLATVLVEQAGEIRLIRRSGSSGSGKSNSTPA